MDFKALAVKSQDIEVIGRAGTPGAQRRGCACAYKHDGALHIREKLCGGRHMVIVDVAVENTVQPCAGHTFEHLLAETKLAGSFMSWNVGKMLVHNSEFPSLGILLSKPFFQFQ